MLNICNAFNIKVINIQFSYKNMVIFQPINNILYRNNSQIVILDHLRMST